MDQNIFTLVSNLRNQVEELETALELERQTPRYSFSDILNFMNRGLTLQAVEVKSFMDDFGPMGPTELADELDISMPQLLGTLDLLDSLGLLNETPTYSFATRLVSVEDVEIPSLDHIPQQDMAEVLAEVFGPVEEDTEENKVVEFRRPSVNIKDMSDETMLDLLIQAKMRADGEWPTVNRTNKARWAERFEAIAEALELPSPHQYTGRFGGIIDAKEKADALLNDRLLAEEPETEVFEADGEVALVDDAEAVEVGAEVLTDIGALFDGLKFMGLDAFRGPDPFTDKPLDN